MSLLRIPAPLLQLLTALLLTAPTTGTPHPHSSSAAGFSYNALVARYECSGELCGWDNQLCCDSGSACYTDSNTQAACSATAAGSSAAGGYWVQFTTTYTRTDLETITSTGSSYTGAAATVSASSSGNARCNYALDETPCGSVCCASDQYCQSIDQCAAATQASTLTTGGGHTTTAASATAGAPLLPTSSGSVLTTETVSPTTTIPYQTPVATGANITMTESDGGGGAALSGGAIAGIVIGVLLGLALLALLCFYCCLKGLLDGCLALFGLGGGRKRKRTEIDEYERRTHHSSRHSGRGGGGGRTWYGAAKGPSRVDRREKDSHKGRNAAGVLAGLGGLWAILGLKRHHNKEKKGGREKYSDYSSYTGTSYLGTSESSASSDRYTRRSRSRPPPRSMGRSRSRR